MNLVIFADAVILSAGYDAFNYNRTISIFQLQNYRFISTKSFLTLFSVTFHVAGLVQHPVWQLQKWMDDK